jgi:DNA modification methylase
MIEMGDKPPKMFFAPLNSIRGMVEMKDRLPIDSTRTCNCGETHLNCMTAKEWVKSQIGVWQFSYEKRDVRKKSVHPAAFPISLAKRVIELFTHEGELVLDPFVGSGTTLVAAQDLNRKAVGFDLQQDYIDLCYERLAQPGLEGTSRVPDQFAIRGDAIDIPLYIEAGSVSLIWTSPPYARLLDRKRTNRSRRDRKNDQYLKNEQYSTDSRDLGTMPLDEYVKSIGVIYGSLLPLLRPKAHCVINICDIWLEGRRTAVHMSVTRELKKHGYELRNTIIWDRRNIVNGIGIFGWPSNYITMGTTFEYIMDFRKAD